jgi:hypothetical protein
LSIFADPISSSSIGYRITIGVSTHPSFWGELKFHSKLKALIFHWPSNFTNSRLYRPWPIWHAGSPWVPTNRRYRWPFRYNGIVNCILEKEGNLPFSTACFAAEVNITTPSLCGQEFHPSQYFLRIPYLFCCSSKFQVVGHHLEVRDFQPFEQLSSTVDPASHLQNMLMS